MSKRKIKEHKPRAVCGESGAGRDVSGVGRMEVAMGGGREIKVNGGRAREMGGVSDFQQPVEARAGAAMVEIRDETTM